ncbi:MAG: GNAT family N-acetyltransferase [Candidatus Thermoplasmatota archaeon]|nr:GNAT family N-acetyltransferase [Candidatus Thermoplasmatota archaeon]
MNIRMASLPDARILTDQNIALAKESENIVLNPDIVLDGVKALLSDPHKGFYLVAEENKTIIGQLMITVEWSDWRNKPIWWVQSVYVQKEWRKKGVFTQLFRVVEQMACTQSVAFLRLYVHEHNTSAILTYEKTGWNQEPYTVYQFSL